MKSIDDLPDGEYIAMFTMAYKVENMMKRFGHNPHHLCGEQRFRKEGSIWWWKWSYGYTSKCIDSGSVRMAVL